MRNRQRRRRSIHGRQREELLVDERLGVQVGVLGDRAADELARGVIQPQLADQASHAVLAAAEPVLGVRDAVDPARNEIAAILRRMQPRWQRYRGGLR